MLSKAECSLSGYLLSWLPVVTRRLRMVLVYSVGQDADEALNLSTTCALLEAWHRATCHVPTTALLLVVLDIAWRTEGRDKTAHFQN
jgi:hypothetical protein